MTRALAIRWILGVSILPLCGCVTPERQSALERMNRLQAENSAIRAQAETEAAKSRVELVRQRSDDLKVIETLTKRIDELSAKIDSLKTSRVEAPRPEPAKPEPPAEDPAVKAELERTKAEMNRQREQAEEALAKAQSRIEAAEAATKAIENAPKEKDTTGESLKGKKLPLSKFIDSAGKMTNISDYIGKKIVVLTVMKGFYSQGICVYCTRQTSDLAKTTGDIRNLDAEVFVCYPGREEHINAFVRSVRDYEKSDDPRFQLPFKVLLDVDQNAVRALNIAGDLAHPTTFIIDKQGVIQYQYTGRTVSDRPAAKDILEEVKKLSK
jgi:peroxiredoxin/HAMP domain-containing protein